MAFSMRLLSISENRGNVRLQQTANVSLKAR